MGDQRGVVDIMDVIERMNRRRGRCSTQCIRREIAKSSCTHCIALTMGVRNRSVQEATTACTKPRGGHKGIWRAVDSSAAVKDFISHSWTHRIRIKPSLHRFTSRSRFHRMDIGIADHYSARGCSCKLRVYFSCHDWWWRPCSSLLRWELIAGGWTSVRGVCSQASVDRRWWNAQSSRSWKHEDRQDTKPVLRQARKETIYAGI